MQTYLQNYFSNRISRCS